MKKKKAFNCVVCDQGFDPEQAALIVEHFKTCKTHEIKLKKEIEKMSEFRWPFGKPKNGEPAGPNYGKPITEVSDKALQWAVENTKVEGQYAAKNQELLNVVNAEILRRAQERVSGSFKVSPIQQAIAPNGAPSASMALLKTISIQQAEHGKTLAKILGILNANFPNSSEIHAEEEFDKF